MKHGIFPISGVVNRSEHTKLVMIASHGKRIDSYGASERRI